MDTVFCAAGPDFAAACEELNRHRYEYPFGYQSVSTQSLFHIVQMALVGKFVEYDPDFFAQGWKSDYVPIEFDLSGIDVPWRVLYNEDEPLCPRSLNEPVIG